MLFTAIFLGALLVGWAVCAFLPWLVLSVATRGNAGLGNLPLSVFAGVVCALAVPVLGLTDVRGLWLSFAAAVLGPALLLLARRFSMGPVSTARTHPTTSEEARPK